ncbi:MAG: B-box zinc finger protein [Candidatus Acidiferrales bacterium]
MKCAVHPDIDAIGFCRNCGKALCQQCAREVRGALYCEQCLAAMMAPQAPAAQFVAPGAPPAYTYPVVVEPQGPNPGTACALGFIPGLGAVYNGEYVKGLIHVIIFGGLIALMSNSDNMPDGIVAMIAVFFAVFYCYMPIEAYRTARAKRLGIPVTGFFGETSAPPAAPGGPGASARHNYTGSIILIVLGVVFLLATTGVLNSRWVWNFWPLLLIAIGVALILKRRAAA